MATTRYWKHYFYRRYKWRAFDFGLMQDSETGAIEGLFEGLTKSLGAVLSGFEDGGATGLNVAIAAGIGCTPSGEMLAATGTTVVTVAGHASTIKNLIVLRKLQTDVDNITRPTSPFDVVPLRKQIQAQIAVISGAAGGAYPSALATDVILLGVEASAAAVTAYDRSKCQLVGKTSNLSHLRRADIVVGNVRNANYKTLAEGVAALVAGNRLRVVESQTIDSTVTVSVDNVEIEFDPAAVLTKGTAATGLVINATGVRLRGGKVSGYSVAGDVGVRLGTSASACTVADMVFLSSPNGVIDSTSNGQSVYGIQFY